MALTGRIWHTNKAGFNLTGPRSNSVKDLNFDGVEKCSGVLWTLVPPITKAGHWND